MSLVGFTLLGSIEAPTLTGAATGVPLLVKPNTEFTAAMLLNLDVGGGDLRFSSDAAGLNQLPCEIVDGLDVVWVKPTGVSISTGATLYVWGDNTGASQPAVGDAFGRNAVWVDYLVVANLDETGNPFINSTGGTDGVAGAGVSANTTSPFGNPATQLNGVDERISFPVSGLSTEVTYSGWANADNFTTDQRFLALYNSAAASTQRYVGAVWVDIGGTGVGWESSVRGVSGAAYSTGDTSNNALTSWQYITVTASATSVKVYVAGVQTTSRVVTESTLLNTTDFFQVGKIWNLTGDGAHFDGSVSTARLSNGTLSPSQISIEYDNQSTTGSWWIASDVGGGTIDVTATLGSINYASNNTTVGVTGSVDVLTTLGTITYTSNNTTVSVSGAVDVIATLGTIDYASNDAVVGVTGSVDVVTTLGTINYTSNNPLVSIGGVVVVQATLGTISYASNDVVIELQGVVDVQTTLGTIQYASNDAVVSLAGLIDVTATIGTISYTSNSTTVTVAAGQDFGVVGVGFADDIYGSTFKPDSITVNFRG